MNIADFKGALPTVVNTQKMVADLESAKQTLSQLFRSAGKIKTPAGGKLASVDKRVLRLAKTSQRNILSLLHSRTTSSRVFANIDVLVRMFDGLPRNIPGRDASIKAASVIAVSEMVNVLTSYTSMYLVELVKSQGAGISKKSIYEPHRPTLNKLTKDAASYALATDYLTSAPGALEKELSNLPDLNVTKYNEPAVRSGMFGGKTPIDLLTSTFIYNPIYHVRLYITEFQVWRYKLLRDEAQQLELLLLALEAERSERPSPGVEREIEMTEERIARARRTMASIAEEDYVA